MKRIFLLLLVILSCYTLHATKPEYRINAKRTVTCKDSTDLKKIKVHVLCSNYSGNFISITLFNHSNERIYIEWENARLYGSRIVFARDNDITMHQPKADEAISANSSSMYREITCETFVRPDYLIPLYKAKDIRKGKAGSKNIPIMLPIRFANGKVVDYNIDVLIYRDTKDNSYEDNFN